ncbi:Malignant T cell-amplified sequence 1-B, partial [Ophiophagus hannah]
MGQKSAGRRAHAQVTLARARVPTQMALHATYGTCAIGSPSREKVNKGIGIENIHYLNDGLWHMKTYK